MPRVRKESALPRHVGPGHQEYGSQCFEDKIVRDPVRLRNQRMGEVFGRQPGLRSVTLRIGGKWVRPAIRWMERGKGGECRGCLDLGQSIQPGRQVGGHLSLNPLEPVGEPQIPWAERVGGQMDERMGFDADRMQGAGRLPDELGRIHPRRK